MTARLEPTASVILGGSGYIGQALVRRLSAGDGPLLVADLQPPSLPPVAPFDPGTFGQPRSRQYCQVDLTDGYATTALLTQVRRGWPGRLVVYHLAALFVKEFARRAHVLPGEYRRQNVDTVETVLDAIERAGPPMRLVFQSSAGLESWTEDQPVSDPYLDSKREAERLVSARCPVEWVILRPVRVIGLDVPYTPHRGAPRRWPVLAGFREARAAATIPSDIVTDLIVGGTWRGDRLEIRVTGANAQLAYVHLSDAASALVAAGGPATPAGERYRVTTVPAVTLADLGEIVVQELESVGTRAVVSCENVADPEFFSPAFSPNFPWRPLLERSREAVRAAIWQYLDVAQQCSHALPAAASLGIQTQQA
jgi:nucleoside-diphosphate-sugar epimerase